MVQFLHLRIDEVQKLHYYKLRGAIMMGELKKMRTEKKMTQQQVADLVGISLRPYKSTFEIPSAKPLSVPQSHLPMYVPLILTKFLISY